MLLSRFEWEIASLLHQIDDGRLDLQPPFQRGQVWSQAKQQKLVDSVLRNWYVPPIHVVVNETLDRDEILDGQQRLRSIHDFCNNRFTVDGGLEPYNEAIAAVDGLHFRDLPRKTQSRFLRFIITTIRLEEYQPSEPGELFFRLNQPMTLTSAEQRNALVGPARDQIKQLSELLEDRSEGQSIGFTNARMNFDDILSRVVLAIEMGTLYEKITAARLASKYRQGKPFSGRSIKRVQQGIIRFTCAVQDAETNIRFNKATLHSWILFFTWNDWLNRPECVERIPEFLVAFESFRTKWPNEQPLSGSSRIMLSKIEDRAYAYVELYSDKASTRVNDVMSIVVRDFCITATLSICGPAVMRSSIPEAKRAIIKNITEIGQLYSNSRSYSYLEQNLAKIGWGKYL